MPIQLHQRRDLSVAMTQPLQKNDGVFPGAWAEEVPARTCFANECLCSESRWGGRGSMSPACCYRFNKRPKRWHVVDRTVQGRRVVLRTR